MTWFLLAMACGSGIRCPEGMAGVVGEEGPFCIHQYEVQVVGSLGNRDQGVGFPDGSTQGKPQAKKGGTPTLATWYQAHAVCAEAGFSLCTSGQWEDACDGLPGAGGRTYPTQGSKAGPGVCAIGDLSSFEKIPLAKSGAFPACRTPEGVYDLMGNLWEWTDPGQKDVAGFPQIDKRGGGHYGAEAVPCTYGSPGSHAPSFDGTIGFRCCVSAGGG